MNNILQLVIILLLCSAVQAQNSFVLKQNRTDFKISLEKKIDNALTGFLFNRETTNLDEAFWGSGLLLRKSDDLFKVLSILFSEDKIVSESELRGALECAFTVYPNEFYSILAEKVRRVSHPKIFSMIVVYLAKNNARLGFLLEVTDEYIKRTFTESHPIIQGLLSYLNKENPMTISEVKTLLSYSYRQNMVFSLQYEERNKPGFVIIKKADGTFAADDEGKTAIIPQFARALSNMPGFLTNGNTPQGIFSIQGVDTSKNIFIGNTPNLQLALPHEIKPELYFRTLPHKTNLMDRDTYLSILPEVLRSRELFFEALIAGAAGRNEIIAHGTATDISYYTNQVYYPYTPTLGCLCMREEWSEITGELDFSDQKKFMDLIIQNSVTNGFFIVTEVDESITQVEIQKILK